MTTDSDYGTAFEPLPGDDLERIDATGGCDESEFTSLVQTALFYRQEAMDLRDEITRLSTALREAAQSLDMAGFTHSADVARGAFQ